MYRELISSIPGVAAYPVISLILFFGIFMMIIIWTFRADKGYLKRMSELPLEEFKSSTLSGDNNNG